MFGVDIEAFLCLDGSSIRCFEENGMRFFPAISHFMRNLSFACAKKWDTRRRMSHLNLRFIVIWKSLFQNRLEASSFAFHEVNA